MSKSLPASFPLLELLLTFLSESWSWDYKESIVRLAYPLLFLILSFSISDIAHAGHRSFWVETVDDSIRAPQCRLLFLDLNTRIGKLEAAKRSAKGSLGSGTKNNLEDMLQSTHFTKQKVRGMRVSDAEGTCLRAVSWQTISEKWYAWKIWNIACHRTSWSVFRLKLNRYRFDQCMKPKAHFELRVWLDAAKS